MVSQVESVPTSTTHTSYHNSKYPTLSLTETTTNTIFDINGDGKLTGNELELARKSRYIQSALSPELGSKLEIQDQTGTIRLSNPESIQTIAQHVDGTGIKNTKITYKDGRAVTLYSSARQKSNASIFNQGKDLRVFGDDATCALIEDYDGEATNIYTHGLSSSIVTDDKENFISANNAGKDYTIDCYVKQPKASKNTFSQGENATLRIDG